ncbi:hypothetical protein [Embleya sp. NPDC059237]|uniref:hypothetical protein n=1 Tax=Embleya sp. NPDC059237 TaxID=3346784 RepID=UPI00367E25C9
MKLARVADRDGGWIFRPRAPSRDDAFYFDDATTQRDPMSIQALLADTLIQSDRVVNGRLEYYLAASTVIPLLLVAYFFNVDIPGTIKRLVGEGRNRAHNWLYRITLEIFAPLAAIVGSIIGETACLIALYSGEPTSTDSDLSIAGLIMLTFAGFIHLIIVSILRLRQLLIRNKSESSRSGATETSGS